MSLIRDDRYEETALAYHCHLISLLDATLQRNGIVEAKKRKKIVEQFLFQWSSFHDRGWLHPSADDEKAYPLLCFTETFLDTNTPLEAIGDVLAPSARFAFHESAQGNTELFYEGDPNAFVEVGSVGE